MYVYNYSNRKVIESKKHKESESHKETGHPVQF